MNLSVRQNYNKRKIRGTKKGKKEFFILTLQAQSINEKIDTLDLSTSKNL